MPSPPITSSESAIVPSTAGRACSAAAMQRSLASAKLPVWKTRRLAPAVR